LYHDLEYESALLGVSSHSEDIDEDKRGHTSIYRVGFESMVDEREYAQSRQDWGNAGTSNWSPVVRSRSLGPDCVAYNFVVLRSVIICHKFTLSDKPKSLCKLDSVFPI